MQALEAILRWLVVVDKNLALCSAEVESPKLLQEAVATIDTVSIPWLRLFYRTEEHFVKTQGVGTIFLYYHVRVYNVEHRLRHLLYCPSANILTIFENELCVVVFRTPSLESLCIKDIVLHDVHVYVDRSSIILVFQAKRYEYRSLRVVVAIDTIYKV